MCVAWVTIATAVLLLLLSAGLHTSITTCLLEDCQELSPQPSSCTLIVHIHSMFLCHYCVVIVTQYTGSELQSTHWTNSCGVCKHPPTQVTTVYCCNSCCSQRVLFHTGRWIWRTMVSLVVTQIRLCQDSTSCECWVHNAIFDRRIDK